MKTVFRTKEDANKERKWLLVDASGVSLGRLSSQVAAWLRGKHKAAYAPHVDVGDFVIVVNASQVKLTGKKLTDKIYHHYTGYIGGMKEIPASRVMARNPGKIIRHAVKGMLPSGPLGFAMLKKLKVYSGAEHPHKAQLPEAREINR